MLEALKAKNAARWQQMAVKTGMISGLDKVARRLNEAKPRYVAVSQKTTVPWPIIAVIHEREASQSWMANLAQGDRWDRVSIHVPRGEGPFSSWEEAAVHALTNDDHMNIWGDWSPGGATTALEKYNGLGYYNHGKPSPYVWASTNQYVSGKYVSDGNYDSGYVDTQYGCAALLARMMAADPTIATDTGWVLNSPGPSPVVIESRDTTWIQVSLNKVLGIGLLVDGKYGPLTKAAVRAFQQRAHILDDGIVGPVTIAALEKALAVPAS